MSARTSARVILASAGTGKTWQLTTRALELFARAVEPERVLASTFTRKAAGEIQSRIFSRVSAAALDEGDCERLDEALELRFSRDDYRDLTLALARDIQRLRISTLDAFFARLAQLYAPELALAPDWRIASPVEIERGKSEALSRALGERESEEWIALLREIERRPASRSVHEVLLQVVQDAHGSFLESGEDAWASIEGPKPFDEEESAAFLRELANVPVPLTQQRKPRVKWANALRESIASFERREWEELFGKGLGKKVLAGEAEFDGVTIGPELEAIFARALRHAASQLAARIDRQNRATWRLLERLDHSWRALQTERGLYRFDDLPRLLAESRGGVASRERLTELAWRLDARIDHLLLDEFQDTAPAQWRILAPLAEELAADGTGARSFFAVGDSKQSIYGWRGAEPRLLNELAASLNVEPERMSLSRRSSSVVISAVNQVFETLDQNPVFDAKPDDRPIAAAWREQFDQHATAKTELAGAVRIFSVAFEDGDDAPTKQLRALERAVELAVEHRARAPRASIAILLRRNRSLPFVVHRLKQAGLVASGEGGSPLTDSSSVQAALSLLHLCDHPSDTAARFHVETSPFASVLGLDRKLDDVQIASFARERRRELLEKGYAALLERLRPALEKNASEFERHRFAQLIELAIAWETEQGLRPSDFVERVRSERVEDTSRALVQVMTVHAAKGLEFDVVILAELEREWGKLEDRFLWRRRDRDPRAELSIVTRNANGAVRSILARSGFPLLEELHREARDRSIRDELSTLYVAMTRAIHALDVVLVERGSSVRFTAAEILRAAFDVPAPDETALAWTVPGSDASWESKFAELSKSEETETPGTRVRRAIEFRRAAAPRELARTSPSRLEQSFGASIELVDAQRRVARLRGSRFHAWFEAIEWLADFAASDDELVQLARRRGFGGEGLEADVDDFRARLAGSVVANLLGRARYSGELEVWRERRFQRVLTSDSRSRELMTGAFDRVVISRAAGRAVAAEIIDFKSDALADGGDESVARATDRHRPQLAAYRAALAAMLELEPAKIRTTLFFVEADRIVELDDR